MPENIKYGTNCVAVQKLRKRRDAVGLAVACNPSIAAMTTLPARPGRRMQVHANAKFLASMTTAVPRMDRSRFFRSLHRDARIAEHVDADVPGLTARSTSATIVSDGTHEGIAASGMKPVADLAKFGERIVVGAARKPSSNSGVAVKESSARAVGKQHFGIDPVAVTALRGDSPARKPPSGTSLPALRIVAPLFGIAVGQLQTLPP